MTERSVVMLDRRWGKKVRGTRVGKEEGEGGGVGGGVVTLSMIAGYSGTTMYLKECYKNTKNVLNPTNASVDEPTHVLRRQHVMSADYCSV
jgi:hypothetical protein